MSLALGMVTIDTSDARTLASWWARQTGGTLGDETPDGSWCEVTLPGGLFLGFQRVDDPTPGKNRLHLDLSAPDRVAEVARLVAAGATVVGENSFGDFPWTTLADPDGNLFDVAEQSATE
jgi:predicted enzyme related to lactoylglutathione lyase